MILKRRVVNIPSEELRPSPKFEAEIRDVLSKPRKAEMLQGVYDVLSRWGDVIPLVYELGASLTITDVDKHNDTEYSWLTPLNSQVSRLGRIATLGGNIQTISGGNMSAWMSQDLQTCDWRIIRVLRVMPTLDLLDRELQAELASLHASILSFDPPALDGAGNLHPTWDDTPHALKTMLTVRVRCVQQVDGLSALFADGAQSNQHGAGGIEHRFELRSVWDDAGGVCAVQFVTTNGRFSLHFGGNGGTPKILSSEAGVLAGFIGRMTKWNDKDTVGRIQTIWRHDIPQAPSMLGGRRAIYVGGAGGQPF
ncbi:hypothetical protein FRC07_011261, partial [Ceratobasidium sp. 392]